MDEADKKTGAGVTGSEMIYCSRSTNGCTDSRSDSYRVFSSSVAGLVPGCPQSGQKDRSRAVVAG